MKNIFYIIIILTGSLTCKGQQPFADYGYEVKVATLSKGKYVEFFDQDSLVQIGTVVINRLTGKITHFVTIDTVYSEATLQPDLISRWISPDPNAHEYYSLSPYNAFANNPILFNDPDGRDIVFYITSSDAEGSSRKKVQFKDLDKNLQKALASFAKTKEGNAFLSQFAKAGDKIGDVEFKKDGAMSKHDLSLAQHSTPTEEEGAFNTYAVKDGKATFEINVNLYNTKGEVEQAVAVGHEAFLHVDQYDDRLVSAIEKDDKKAISNIVRERRLNRDDRNGGPEHDSYLSGQKGYAKMTNYVGQLKQIYNPGKVQEQMKKHDQALKGQPKKTN